MALETSLIDFVEGAWPQISPAEYKKCWAIDGLCEHLEAVTNGHIKRLLINMPPRTGKTTVTSICWPAWTWARRQKTFWSGSRVRFLCGSYGQKLSLENSNLTRRLILSPWYQDRWGTRVVLTEDQNTKEQFDLTDGGKRIAVSVGSSLLGIGGDIVAVDDPHNTAEIESDADRETATTWFKEIRSTRLNDPKQSALVVNMQRLHDEDTSGQIINGEDYEEWTHFMVPMEFDPARRCVTVLKWDAAGSVPLETWKDPRTEEDELMWEDRFGPDEVAALKRDLGPYMASGRLQQSPIPRGGSILRRDYWQPWDEIAAREQGVEVVDGDPKYPPFEFVLASADTAYTEKEENDPTGFTIWGVWRDRQDKPRVMLCWAWAKHCELHGKPIERKVGETKKSFDMRSMPSWGLVEWIAYSCRRFKVDKLLIEAKASGLTVAQEMQRLYREDGWSIELIKPVGDKVARAHAVEPAFAAGLIYAPDEDWAEKVFAQAEVFPKGKHDDLVDSSTQAIQWLRRSGLISHNFEVAAELREAMQFKPEARPLYDA